MEIAAFAAHGPGQPLERFAYRPEPLGPQDVEVQIEFCGICHSDVHLIDNDWGISQYPLVPGHEIVGVVSARGEAVAHLEVGQRVGIGWLRGACLHCEWCLRGEENVCPERQATCVGHYGGFARAIRVHSRFAFPLPDGLEPAAAAPLLCAGITVYSPLRQAWQGHPLRVGVVGLGGLGHLAVKFARAFGSEVTVFSSRQEKQAEAERLGAHHFLSSTDPAQIQKAAGRLDLIIATVHVPLAWEAFVNCLRPKGTLCLLSGLAGTLNIAAGQLMEGHRTVKGSTVGNCWQTREMLQFAAWNGIQPEIEIFPAGRINEAIQRVRENAVHFRAVVDFRQAFNESRAADPR
ncbi:MAG: NAD(P)-dependent alcohol dehydrogenase [Calditrichaeota bacterium]|nr:MAG: NAD(P)-dependent alcohol dehydrogenase [Calditrichota bacterium]